MAKRIIPPIENDRIRLRLLEERDLPMTLAWRNQDQIRKGFFNSEVISPAQHQAWFKGYLERDHDYVFIIEETYEFHRPIGQISLYNIDWETKRAELGRFMIGEIEAQGRDLGKKSTRILLEVAFHQLGLKEIYLRVIKHNHPAIKIYRHCGFKLSQEHGDMIMMRLFNPYFQMKS